MLLQYNLRLTGCLPLFFFHCFVFILWTFAGFVTDFDFSPFHDGLLATGAEDCYVKLWHIPEGGVTGTMTTPTSSLPQMEVYKHWQLLTKICFLRQWS